jgi:uncharacterized membrane protein AbrB (regulator of aidB expression)
MGCAMNKLLCAIGATILSLAAIPSALFAGLLYSKFIIFIVSGKTLYLDTWLDYAIGGLLGVAFGASTIGVIAVCGFIVSWLWCFFYEHCTRFLDRG